MNARFAGFYEEALKEAEAKEAEAYEKFGKEAEENIASYKAQIQERLAELETTFAGNLAEISRNVNESLTAAEKTALRVKAECGASDDKIEQARRAFEHALTEIDGNVAQFKTDTAAHIVELSTSIADAEKNLRAEYEKRHLSALSELDGELSAYKTEFEYRMSRLEASGSDVDTLESSLRAAMEDVGQRVLGDFDAFTAEQKKRHDDFAAELKEHSDMLENELTIIEENIEDLKKTALGSMSEKLEGFEAEFDRDLQEKGERINSELLAWKDGFDERIAEFTKAYTNERKALEEGYDESIRERLAELALRHDEQTSNIAESIAAAQKDSEEKLSGIKHLVEDFGAALRQKINDSAASSDEFLKESLARTEKTLSDTLSSLQTRLSEKMDGFENEIRIRKENGSAAMDKALEEFEDWKNALNTRFGSSNEAFERRLLSLKEDSERAVRDTETFITAACERFTQTAQSDIAGETERLKAELDDRMEEIGGLQKSAEAKIEAIQKIVDDFTAEIQDKVERTASSSDSYLKVSLEDVQKNIDGELSLFKDRLQGSFNTFEDEIRLRQSTGSSAIEAALEDFTAWKRNLKSQFDESKTALDNDLTALKTEADGKVEEARLLMERGFSRFSDSMRSKIDDEAEKLEKNMADYALSIRETQKAVQGKIDEIERFVSDFSQELREKSKAAASDADSLLKDRLLDSQKGLEAGLAALKTQLTDEMRSFESELDERKKAGSAAIDGALEEFSMWREKLQRQLDESKIKFDTEVGSLKEDTLSKLEGARAFIDGEYDRFAASSRQKIAEEAEKLERAIDEYAKEYAAKQDAISADIGGLEEKARASLAGYESRSSEIVSRLEAMYDRMLKDLEERVNRQNADAEKKIDALSEELEQAAERSRSEQTAFVLKMRQDSNDMQTQLADLQHELQSLKNMSAEYEKAELIKAALDDKIRALSEDFMRLEDFKSAAASLTAQYGDVMKIKNEIDRELAGYEEQQKRMDDVSLKYEKAISSSSLVEEKILTLQSTFDELQSMEMRVRDFQETLAGISGRYDRLEQKNEVIDRVCKGVDTSFENLKAIEDRLRDCSRRTETLPDEIKSVQRDVDALLKNGDKVSDVVEKLSNLQNILDDAERRMKDLESARKGIGRSEQRLVELNSKIESRFNELAFISKRDAESSPNQSDSHINPQERELVRSLKLQGWTIPAIASRLKRSQAEIELLLELPIE